VKRNGSAGREPPPDTPAAAAERKAQVDAEMWRQIVSEIRRLEGAKAGQPPLATADEIWNSIRFMLRRRNIPVEVLLFMDKLQVKQSKHRPSWTIEQRTLAAVNLIESIDSLTSELRSGGKRNAQQMAIAQRAAEATAEAAAEAAKAGLPPPSEIEPETLARRYREKIEDLRRLWPSDTDFAASHPPRPKKTASPKRRKTT
jgi:hypothetical protein